MNDTIIKEKLLRKVRKAEYLSIFKQLDSPEITRLFDKEENDQLILLSSRYYESTNQNNKGVINDNDYRLEINKISKSLISLFTEKNSANTLTKNKISAKNAEELLGSLVISINEIFEDLDSRIPNYDWLKEIISRYAKVKKKWDDRRFQIAIMALIKAGKSTLLNSWIGKEFLPSASFAETMRIIRIRHNSRRKVGVLFDEKKEVARGVDAIRSYIRKINDSDRDLDIGIEGELRLEFSLSSLKSKRLSGYGFDFLDTPGVNEHGIPTLQAKVERLVKNSDVIIYLLDFTKLKTADENQMFESLKEWKVEILNQIKNRLFFVVNKIDKINRHDKEMNMTQVDIRRYVQNILKTSLKIDINEENIVLISAERALLCKLLEQDNLITDGQLNDFKERAFGEIGAKLATKESCIKAIPEILEKSGFTELEDKVLQTIYKKRANILISSVIDDIEKILKQAINNIDVGRSALISKIKNIDELKEKITTFQEELKDIQEEIIEFKKKAYEPIDKRFDEFEEGITDLIKKAFSDTSGVRPRFQWLQVLTDLLGETEYLIIDNDSNSIQNKIQTINNLVNKYLRNKFDSLWNKIAEDQYLEFTKFSNEINKRSEPLIRSIEEEINKALQIKLYPSGISPEKPTLNQFYNETQNSLASITSSKEKSNMNFLESLWHRFLRIFGLGRKEIISQEFRISSADYKKMVLETIEPTLKMARKKTKNFIDKKYINSVNSNAKNINQYANQYISIIEKAIKSKKKGAYDIDGRIKDMEKDKTRLKNQLLKVDKIIEIF